MPPWPGIPDWQDSAAYAELLQVDRSGFAWEWLRRRRDYRAAALAAFSARSRQECARLEEPEAAAWGLHAFVDPMLAAPTARPVWRADRLRLLSATAEPSADDSDAFVLSRFEPFATVVEGRRMRHLLLSDGYRGIRLDIRGASPGDRPVRLRYDICGFRRLSGDILALRQLAHLRDRGHFSRSLHRPVDRARRLVLLLRAFDALGANASQRTIAAVLLSSAAADVNWRIQSSSLRSQAQRLVRAAQAMAAGGFWHLLGVPPDT